LHNPANKQTNTNADENITSLAKVSKIFQSTVILHNAPTCPRPLQTTKRPNKCRSTPRPHMASRYNIWCWSQARRSNVTHVDTSRLHSLIAL